MRDAMRQGDSVAVGLGCGHPHVKPGETCPHCGEQLPVPPQEANHHEQA